MTPTEITVAEKEKSGKTPPAAWLFFQRWMANPLSMGSVTPSSGALCKLIRQHVVCAKDQVVVEFGGGTGAITKSLLQSGIPGERIFTFEIDDHLSHYLRGHYPDVNVVHADCRKAPDVLGPNLVGKVGTVVIGIPMLNLPMRVQKEVVEACFKILPEGGRFILYTYGVGSPLNQRTLGLKGKRLGFTPLNVPPASVWGYWKA